MEYNDFPILSNEDYLNLNNFYFQNSSFEDREFYINKISLKIFSCLNISLNNSELPKEIQTEIKISQTKLNTVLENLNIKAPDSYSVKSFNLLTFILNLIDILSVLNSWTKTETKEYYKNLIISNTNIILETLNNIFLKLNKFKIKIFKYM